MKRIFTRSSWRPLQSATLLLFISFCLSTPRTEATGQSLAEAIARAVAPPVKLTPSDARPGYEFGWSVSIDGNRALVGAYDGADYFTGAAYIFYFDGTNWTQEAKLTASDENRYDNFGYAVSLSGDRALVAADQVAAYVFVRNGTTWTQEAKLTSPDQTPNFAGSVSLSGERAIIGDPGVGQHGAAFIFVENGGMWSQEAELTPESGTNTQFGKSVALSGKRAVVGVTYTNYTLPGYASVYSLTHGVWTFDADLRPSNSQNDGTGTAVALSGKTAVLGADYYLNENGVPTGAAFVYTAQGKSWNLAATLIPPDGGKYDAFGSSLAASAKRVLVGSSSHNNEAGAAYLYSSDGGTFHLQTEFTSPDGAAPDEFGNGVALSGREFLIGAPGAAPDGNGSGAAFVFGH